MVMDNEALTKNKQVLPYKGCQVIKVQDLSSL